MRCSAILYRRNSRVNASSIAACLKLIGATINSRFTSVKTLAADRLQKDISQFGAGCISLIPGRIKQ